MYQRRLLAIAFLISLVFVTVAIAFKGHSALGLLTHPLRSITTGVNDDKVIAAGDSAVAPDFAKGVWINSDPLTLKGLRGRVVVVDFWTFACYNCRNTLPYLKDWDARYREKGLTIVGVHSPELDQEKVLDNVRRETAALGIRYPVVTDNDYDTWNSYHVEAWPTMILLDKEGRIRWTHVGEGAYEETEKTIQKLLAEETKVK
jgi:thiol-disulfide isomerase/thioredoxin